MTETIVEVVSFRLLPGADESGFLAAAEAAGAVLAGRNGFVARRLSVGADGLWLDHVEWRSLADAEAAAAAFPADARVAPFLRPIDGASVRMRHERLLLRSG